MVKVITREEVSGKNVTGFDKYLRNPIASHRVVLL